MNTTKDAKIIPENIFDKLVEVINLLEIIEEGNFCDSKTMSIIKIIKRDVVFVFDNILELK